MPVIFRPYITYRNATVMEITTWVQEYFQKTLSVNTIHHAIHRCRLKLYKPKKKPYLNMIQKRRHFLWAKAHLKWTVAKWKTVLWSDESKFEVLFGKLGCHVIRTKEDKDNPSCYQHSVQKPASLMVWGCMSACGMGSIHIWKGTINAETSWLRRRRIRVLKWPDCSPDLSPIENIWRIIKRKMQQRRPKTVKQLEACIRQEWDNIPIPKIKQLVSSVPRRLQTGTEEVMPHSGKHGLVPTFLRCVDAMKFKINLFFH
uniref:Tc1-like transposase DDE domain-containing protein n=1 Tax=Cyprinus carpio carpio TaxID=630221 RepID=A0A9J7Y7Q6_CYPCA